SVGDDEPPPEQLVRHALASAREVARIAVLEPVARVLRHHHEHFDGSGGPDGLSGTDIPLPCRILAAAEAYLFALQRWGDPETALRCVRRRAGRVYDHRVVNALEDIGPAYAGTDPLMGSVVSELTAAVDQLRRFVREADVGG